MEKSRGNDLVSWYNYMPVEMLICPSIAPSHRTGSGYNIVRKRVR